MSTQRESSSPIDRLGRPLSELRISVTDRCNFRCTYCMPEERYGEDYVFAPRADILRFEEIARIARIAVQRLGVRKLRLTGGEPLLRRDLEQLIAMLAAIDQTVDLTLTTNGSLLEGRAERLRAAGLQRITISLDALDEPTFLRMSGGRGALADVIAGVEAARRAGLTPIKLNCVVQRGVNEHAIEALAKRFAGSDVIVRFIEFMDVGTVNGWSLTDIVPADEIRAALERVGALERIEERPGEVAERYRYRDGSGEVGIIASVTRPFCGDCNRARISADGRFLTCLFAEHGADLRAPLRDGQSDDAIAARMTEAWRAREDRYSELRAELRANTSHKRRLEMFQIGG